MTRLHALNSHFCVTNKLGTHEKYFRSERELVAYIKRTPTVNADRGYYIKYLTAYARTRAVYLENLIK